MPKPKPKRKNEKNPTFRVVNYSYSFTKEGGWGLLYPITCCQFTQYVFAPKFGGSDGRKKIIIWASFFALLSDKEYYDGVDEHDDG